MKLKKIFDNLLGMIRLIINQCPDKDEIKKLKHAPLFLTHYPSQKNKKVPQLNSHNKAQPKRVGPRHSGTQIFNKPRK
jgi:hypothetical protein